MALSTNAMLLLDQRTLQIKYRIPATEIYRLSLSPYHDNIAVFHVKDVSFFSNSTLSTTDDKFLSLKKSFLNLVYLAFFFLVGNGSKEGRFCLSNSTCHRSHNKAIFGDSKCNGTTTRNLY